VLVPKAAVHEDGGSVTREYNIRAPRQVTTVQTKAIAHCMQNSAYCNLRCSISGPYRRHSLAALLWRPTHSKSMTKLDIRAANQAWGNSWGAVYGSSPLHEPYSCYSHGCDQIGLSQKPYLCKGFNGRSERI
jgi:hypothetical protein